MSRTECDDEVHENENKMFAHVREWSEQDQMNAHYIGVIMQTICTFQLVGRRKVVTTHAGNKNQQKIWASTAFDENIEEKTARRTSFENETSNHNR